MLRTFLEGVAKQAGHRVEITRITPDAWHEASVLGFVRGDYEPMRLVVAGAVVASPSGT